jgi:hypothetical protein
LLRSNRPTRLSLWPVSILAAALARRRSKTGLEREFNDVAFSDKSLNLAQTEARTSAQLVIAELHIPT